VRGQTRVRDLDVFRFSFDPKDDGPTTWAECLRVLKPGADPANGQRIAASFVGGRIKDVALLEHVRSTHVLT
jgi:hypothetical protein